MTRETLCEEIVSSFYHRLPSAEPDCFDIYQNNHETALAIWNADTPGDCVDVLVNGKFSPVLRQHRSQIADDLIVGLDGKFQICSFNSAYRCS